MTSAQRKMLIIGLVPVLVLVATGAAVTVSLIRGKLPYSYSASYAPGPQGVKVVSDVSLELLASADHLLYVAKETRDRVVSLASVHRDAVPAHAAAHRQGHEYAETAPPASTC